MTSIVLSPVTLDQLEHIIRSCVQAEVKAIAQNLHEREDSIIDAQQVCQEFNISPPTLIKYRKQGKIPYIRIGNRIRYKKHEVVEALRGKMAG